MAKQPGGALAVHRLHSPEELAGMRELANSML